MSKKIHEILNKDRSKQRAMGNGKGAFEDDPNYSYLSEEGGWLKTHEELVEEGLDPDKANELLMKNVEVTADEDKIRKNRGTNGWSR